MDSPVARLKNILDLSPAELEEWLLARGLKRFNKDQIIQWLYQKRVASFEAMTNLARATRDELNEHFLIGVLSVLERFPSRLDGTIKYLLQLHDGQNVEAVLMPQKNRLTLCVSSQVGCAMGCSFCKTAEMKLKRNLGVGEIVGQILAIQNDLGVLPKERVPEKGRITNIVMMGMGEPFHNYENVVKAVSLMILDKGLGLSRRKVTVSTVGLVPQIEAFAVDSPVKLAVSLNATTDEQRREIMPMAKKYPLEELTRACLKYAQRSGNKVTWEYVMFHGFNDTMEDMKRLVRLASHVPCKVNLIPFNPYPGSPYSRPPESHILKCFQYLADRNIQVNIRYSKGLDVMAACGQLSTMKQNVKQNEKGENLCPTSIV